MPEKTAHEKYLAGEPLNQELADIRDGKISFVDPPPTPTAWARDSSPDDPTRELTLAERGHLRELRMHAGWAVLQRVGEKLFENHKKGAIALSQHNPLANGDGIAQEWAYTAMFRRALIEIDGAVSAEIVKLEATKGTKTQ